MHSRVDKPMSRSSLRSSRFGLVTFLGVVVASSAGCPSTVAALRAVSGPVEVHDEEWAHLEAAPTAERPEPGECVGFHPTIRWYEASSPSTAPPAPLDVQDLAATVETPETCALDMLEGGHDFEVRGVAEGTCRVSVRYVHPVTRRPIDDELSIEFKKPIARRPAVEMERPRELQCRGDRAAAGVGP
jgi:hypothetical protein